MRRVILQNFREYPHGAVAKKNVARPSESLRFAREMAESTECSTCDRGVGAQNGAPPLSVGAAARFDTRGRLDDSATNQRIHSHCLHASHWIVIFARVGRLRRALCVQRRERGTFVALRNEVEINARIQPVITLRCRQCYYRYRISCYQAGARALLPASQISARGVKISTCC